MNENAHLVSSLFFVFTNQSVVVDMNAVNGEWMNGAASKMMIDGDVDIWRIKWMDGCWVCDAAIVG